jgi:hypothetical protein
MQQAAASAPPTTTSFAGMLAALAAPSPKSVPAWSEDDLEDDVATLSYERALRAHARYRSPAFTGESLTQFAEPGLKAAPRPSPVALPGIPEKEAFAANAAESVSLGHPSVALGRDLKCASITIRLSRTECAQLRKRAAEAGLTVSAYLRSCTFEVESLRGLVKDTMAQLRAATTAGKPARSNSAGPFRRGWLRRFLLLFHGGQRADCA